MLLTGTAVLEDKAVEDVGGEISEAGWQILCRMISGQEMVAEGHTIMHDILA